MTLTKEWLEQTIAELEEERDATPGAVNEDAANALAAMKLALASLTAEPVAWQWEYRDKNHVTNDQARAKFVAQDGDVTVQPLFTAPPASVSVPDEMEPVLKDGEIIAYERHGERFSSVVGAAWNACRDAMLKKVVVTPKSNDWRNYEATFDFSGKPVADSKEHSKYPECLPCTVLLEPGMKFGKGVSTEVMLNALLRREERNVQLERMTPEQRAEHDAGLQEFAAMLQGAAGNSPAIPDGYALVPVKLTAENGAKGALLGEFSEIKFISCPECFGDDDCETCDGSGRIEVKLPVTWTTIKAIWAKGVEHFAAAPQQEA